MKKEALRPRSARRTREERASGAAGGGSRGAEGEARADMYWRGPEVASASVLA